MLRSLTEYLEILALATRINNHQKKPFAISKLPAEIFIPAPGRILTTCDHLKTSTGKTPTIFNPLIFSPFEFFILAAQPQITIALNSFEITSKPLQTSSLMINLFIYVRGW